MPYEFNALLRHEAAHVEDIREIRRRAGEGGRWIVFKFSRGSASVTHWRRIDDLVARLRTSNPAIKLNYDD
ncbi:MAG TPA: hypothetical protein VL856_19690 [Acidimicrobiia bacterium]|nr:hypothetical protein [Acidimicrobiia bacterium]